MVPKWWLGFNCWEQQANRAYSGEQWESIEVNQSAMEGMTQCELVTNLITLDTNSPAQIWNWINTVCVWIRNNDE